MVDQEYKFRIPLVRRLRRHVLKLPPLLVWSAALLGATVLYLHQDRGVMLAGLALEVSSTVSTVEPGRLTQVLVEQGQAVTKGQIVAALDAAAPTLELRQARIELLRLKKELARERSLQALDAADRRLDRRNQLRRFARDAEDSRIDYLQELADLAEARIRAQGLALTLARTKELSGKGLSPGSQLDFDRTAYEALTKRIAESAPLLHRMKERLRAMEGRRDRLQKELAAEGSDPEPLLAPHRHAIELQQSRIELANLQLTRLVLRAPLAGVVTEVLLRAGEAVVAGAVIARITETRAREVVAWVPEASILAVKRGAVVKLRRLAAPGEGHLGRVSMLGARLEPQPLRLNMNLRTPLWGRPIRVELPDSLAAVPGEAFELVIEP